MSKKSNSNKVLSKDNSKSIASAILAINNSPICDSYINNGVVVDYSKRFSPLFGISKNDRNSINEALLKIAYSMSDFDDKELDEFKRLNIFYDRRSSVYICTDDPENNLKHNALNDINAIMNSILGCLGSFKILKDNLILMAQELARTAYNILYAHSTPDINVKEKDMLICEYFDIRIRYVKEFVPLLAPDLEVIKNENHFDNDFINMVESKGYNLKTISVTKMNNYAIIIDKLFGNDVHSITSKYLNMVE